MPVLVLLSPFAYVDYCRVGADVRWARLVRACARVFAHVDVTDETIIALGGAHDARGSASRIRITHDGHGIFMVVGSHGRESLLRHYEVLAVFDLFRRASDALWFFDEYELL